MNEHNFGRVTRFRLPYKELYGGVSALKKEHFERVNGFSNKFFGWGGEDDDMWVRYGRIPFSYIFNKIGTNYIEW